MNNTTYKTNLQRQLHEAGYKKHVSNYYENFRKTNTLFQKKIKDERGVLYFINIWWYDRNKYDLGSIEEDIEIETQFWKDGNPFTVVILFEKDVDKAEEYLYHMWNILNLGYYEEFN